ncbi:hypothetical protein [Humisphaera borealis]|uniref:Uncharacterized protein n=1 Tax=Humisphaera borealis TaxID=2807512 RepID=A0A7M2WZE0_9BACT|nr:hypothetical protein [Humisphaera borealis]QOV90887.1 hypothetical protein IPV69_05875 [Humisphaera borealis]
MPLDPHNLLDKLATYLVATLSINESGGRSIWTGPADETQVPLDSLGRVGVYTELRNYAGAVSTIGLPTASIQARSVGYVEADVRARALAIVRALLDAQGKPIRNLQLPTSGTATHKILAVQNLRGPDYINRDDKGRPEWVANFDLEYVPL